MRSGNDLLRFLRGLQRGVALINRQSSRDERRVMIRLFLNDLQTVREELDRLNGGGSEEVHRIYLELAAGARQMVARDGRGIAPDDEESYRGTRGHVKRNGGNPIRRRAGNDGDAHSNVEQGDPPVLRFVCSIGSPTAQALSLLAFAAGLVAVAAAGRK